MSERLPGTCRDFVRGRRSYQGAALISQHGAGLPVAENLASGSCCRPGNPNSDRRLVNQVHRERLRNAVGVERLLRAEVGPVVERARPRNRLRPGVSAQRGEIPFESRVHAAESPDQRDTPQLGF